MTATEPTPYHPLGRRARGDEGVALVEFAIVAIMFFTLVFGIIAFGVLLSFQQTLTNGANEGARAGAVTADDKTTVDDPLTIPIEGDERGDATLTAIDQYNAWGKSCNAGDGLTCTYTPHDCGGVTNTAALPDCVTVVLTYDYQNFPLLPDFPFIGEFIPDTLVANATAQISDP